MTDEKFPQLITVLLNDEAITVTLDASLNTILQLKGYDVSSIAIALNQTIVNKQAYAKTFLTDGDRIDIVTAMQGG